MPVHQVGHTALGDADPACLQSLMHVGHTAVLTEAPLAKQGNDVQAKFTMGQRPTPFFFGTLAFVIVGTIRLATLADHEGQVQLARQCGNVAMAVVGHPQRLTTCFTQLPEWSQGRFVRRHGARSSSSHLLSPVGVSLLFLGLSACFSFQLTPPFKPSLPFSLFLILAQTVYLSQNVSLFLHVF